MSTLIYFDSLGSHLTGAQREAISIAQTLGSPEAVVGAPVTPEQLDELGSAGISRVLTAGEDPSGSLAIGQADLLVAAVRATGASAVLSPTTAADTEVMARAAALTESGIITDAVSVGEDLVVEKSVLAGTGVSRSRGVTPTVFITVKPGAAPQAPATEAGPASLEQVQTQGRSGAAVTSRTPSASTGRPGLGEARIVVSGGRGTEGDFSAVEQLADALGAAVGASRVATDSGWIGHDLQVGQTGTAVAPQLYIAAGISGAVQHLAGMRTAGTIVAVNTDSDAPIFEYADLGIVGRLQDVLPQAAEEIERRRA